MTTPKTQGRFDIHKFFARGESLVATTGMAFIAILALAVGGVVWISARTIDDSVYAQGEEQINETIGLMASQAELRLSDGDLPGLRRLMLDAVASGMIEECEVSVPDLGIIASSNVGNGALTELSDTWRAAPDVIPSIVHNEEMQRTVVLEPLTVDGKSGMTLKIVVSRSIEMAGSDSIRFSSVGIMSVGLVLMLLVYRRFRNRLGALAGIGEALRAAGEGERRIGCLTVGERLGPEALIWNTLLSERESLERAIDDHEIIEISGGGVVESIGLPAACNTLTQGVILVEPDLQVVYANGAACVFLRTTRDAMLNISLEKVPDSKRIVETVRSILDNHGASRQILEIGDADKIDTQGAILRVVVTRVEEDDPPRAMIFIDDVTQQRLADQSQSAFIAQATHELRTPLTTIRLYAEEAVEAGSDGEQVREKALNVINSETRRLERIVGDMLCVSEIEAGSLSIRAETVRTEQIFIELQEDYMAQAKEKSIEMVFDLPPKFPSIQADRDRLGQALHNLVGNAIKYTPSGGRVHVEASFADNNSLTVDVTDTGIGIEESQQERIFDRFCRADDRRISQVTGSGLGLALARQITRLHGGDVVLVESAIDKGSTFRLTVPGPDELAKAA